MKPIALTAIAIVVLLATPIATTDAAVQQSSGKVTWTGQLPEGTTSVVIKKADRTSKPPGELDAQFPANATLDLVNFENVASVPGESVECVNNNDGETVVNGIRAAKPKTPIKLMFDWRAY
jgi:hypothetical protein